MRCTTAEQATGIFEIVEARGSGVIPVVGQTGSPAKAWPGPRRSGRGSQESHAAVSGRAVCIADLQLDGWHPWFVVGVRIVAIKPEDVHGVTFGGLRLSRPRHATGSRQLSSDGGTWQMSPAVFALDRPNACALPHSPPPVIDAGQHARRLGSLVFDA